MQPARTPWLIPSAWRRGARPILVSMLGLVLVGTLGACDRTPKLVPEGPDTLAVTPADSTVVFMQRAQRLWEERRAEDAAFLTAAVLHADLRWRPPDTWESRAAALLDSLNVGVEVKSSKCAVFVNMFSRADPLGSSWPFVFWCSADTIEHELLEGRGMRLLDALTRGLPGSVEGQGLAVLYGRHGPAGDQPVLIVWRPDDGGWSVVQTLGPDSLGGTGTGRFETFDFATDLVTRTYSVPDGFQECPSCPHVNRERRFRWQRQRFVSISESVTETPYAAFVRFIQALRGADYVGAMNHVSDRQVLERAMHFGWARSLEPWRAAPGTNDRANQMVFFHGQLEAYKVWFEPFGERWVLSSVDTTTRTLETP